MYAHCNSAQSMCSIELLFYIEFFLSVSTSNEHEEQLEQELSSAQAQITELKNDLEKMKRKLSVEKKQITGKNNYNY